MMFVTGGVGAGKLAFACEASGLGPADFFDGAASCGESLESSPAVFHAQELVREDGADLAALIRTLSSKHVVIADEVGCGVVPLRAEDRAWRERAGRLACALAAEAEAVVRLVAGVPQVIKGSL